jgi:hypothetical protein
MRGGVRAIKIKPTDENPDKLNVKRERFQALPKNRYGYTNDKAVDELKRLLPGLDRVKGTRSGY